MTRTILLAAVVGTAALSVHGWHAHQQAVLERQVRALTSDDAEHTDIPAVVYFWAPWCGACRTMTPNFAEAARELEPDVRSLKVNVDAAPELANALGIHSIPTLAVFKDGRVLDREGGIIATSNIVRWVQSEAGTSGR